MRRVDLKTIELDPEFITTNLKTMSIFQKLDDDEIKKIMHISQINHFERGEVIIENGKKQSNFYGILKGTVNATIEKDQKKALVATIEAGDIFGETGIFADLKSTAEIKAKEDSYILTINGQKFLNLLKNDHKIGTKVLLFMVYSLIYKMHESHYDSCDTQIKYQRDRIKKFMENYL